MERRELCLVKYLRPCYKNEKQTTYVSLKESLSKILTRLSSADYLLNKISIAHSILSNICLGTFRAIKPSVIQ